MRCRQYLKVAHHVPGRVRIKYQFDLMYQPAVRALLNTHGDGGAYGKGIYQLVQRITAFVKNGASSAIPGIRTVRLNWRGRSLIIEYDPKLFPPEWIDDLLATRDAAHFGSILDNLAQRATAVPNRDGRKSEHRILNESQQIIRDR